MNSSSSETVPVSVAATGASWTSAAAKNPAMVALVVGVAGILLTVIGLAAGDTTRVALASLIALIFWLGIGVGMLFLVMLFHLFDAGWPGVIRRPLEHGLAVFPWIGGLFMLLIFFSVFSGIPWKWMDTANPVLVAGEMERVGEDLLYLHKAAYLNSPFFILRSLLYFGIFIGIATMLRRASMAQDIDGDPKWTTSCRKWSAAGVILVALSVSFGAFDWLMSLDYHWFSTMFGVWFFSTSIRAAIAAIVLISLFLVRLGVFEGVFGRAHLYELGRLTLAFTIFWAYISFSQYFLIWNANIPEVTFWFVNREWGSWWWVGLALIFGNFLVPFLFLLLYRNKVTSGRMAFISVWILAFFLLDLYFNILPSELTEAEVPAYLFGISFWDLTALAGVGGLCVWAFLKSYASSRVIPVRDPRILESLKHHE
ncbi:MAG: hypothetical protein WD490_03220 [Opitutales bacterium]